MLDWWDSVLLVAFYGPHITKDFFLCVVWIKGIRKDISHKSQVLIWRECPRSWRTCRVRVSIQPHEMVRTHCFPSCLGI